MKTTIEVEEVVGEGVINQVEGGVVGSKWIRDHQHLLFHMVHTCIVHKIILLLNVLIQPEYLNLIGEFTYKIKPK